MKILVLFLIGFIVSSTEVSAQADIKLEIGAKLPRKYITKKNVTFTFTAASQMDPSIEKTIANVDYDIAFKEDTRRITYISTMDEDFRTVNCLKVGDEITFTKEELIISPYWEIRAPAAPDGWFPVIGFDQPMSLDHFIANLKDGVKTTMTIERFSKGGR